MKVLMSVSHITFGCFVSSVYVGLSVQHLQFDIEGEA